MAKASSLLLLLLLTIFAVLSLSATTHGSDTSFIKGSCSATNYPDLCVQSLSIYATTVKKSPRRLAMTALSVSLSKAQETKSFVWRLSKLKGLKHGEYAALIDCVEEIGETVNQLGKSAEELKKASKKRSAEFEWHMSNVETWVSAALTDETTCVDGFAGKAVNGRVKASIGARIVNLAQLTSNALALINKFASRT